MGGAIARGLVERSGRLAGEIGVVEPDSSRRAGFTAAGFAAVREPAGIADRLAPGAILVLAIKPQMLPAAAPALQPLAAGRLVLSILAGATRDLVRQALTEPSGQAPPVRVIRAMPNTPALVGRGLAAIARDADADPADMERARAILGAVGETVEIDEALMDAFTAVVGSGPAYVFLLAEAMAAGARAVGFDPRTAERLARSTVVGAGAMLDELDEAATDLRQRVTSKGGTTAAALDALEGADFVDAIVRAIAAARDRGAALARALRAQ